ncbi:MAG: DUF393 domain-containing protein [bacterium]|nr:DUF393 domain-containing protein [bacterium]
MSQGLSPTPETETLPIVFYDGACGLCHHTVRYLIREDPEGERFRFAPLGGETFRRLLDPALRDDLPDSVVVLAPDGKVHTRTDATLALLTRLGGRHLGRARALRAVPRPLRDLAYVTVAALRHRVWARPDDVCPVVSPELRARFDP